MTSLQEQQARAREEFDSLEKAWCDVANEYALPCSSARAFLDTIIARTRKETLDEARAEKEVVVDALIGVYEQYCLNGHDFVSAGERACKVLEMQGYSAFSRAGRLRSLRGEIEGGV